MANAGIRHLGSGTKEIILDLAAHLWAITREEAPTIWIGRGYDTNRATEHGTGRALDVIVAERVGRLPTREEKAAGELVVAWLIRHADQLHIRHIIWDRRIWKRRYRHTPTAWSRLTSRSGVSDWHEDHIHILVDDEKGTVPQTPLTPTGGDQPTPPPEREEDIMASIEDLRQVLREELHHSNHERYPSPLRLDGEDAPDMSRTDLLQQDYRQGRGTYEMVRALQQQVAALTALVRTLTKGRE